ncbi:bis(5'-nucleosyl)-tetraphosphatase (symmetrical) [Methylophilaceae bacterium]|nr:bis(5'-nucleosyl)-tetraphosphatase (symmetrical) [Methylophilaceae bacterium]
MATYAIGDIQGCFHSFQNLLKRFGFNAEHDRLWLVGDIINRGAGSLEMLRWAYEHQHALVMVLGNHDLHALAVAEGHVPQHRNDTLQPILDAADADQLLAWLRQQPLLHREHGYLMVHAGLLPQWSVEQAVELAAEVAAVLRGSHYRDFLSQMYGNQPNQWHEFLQGIDRLRLITNAMTRLRVCTPDGQMEFKFTGELQDVPAGYQPWFDLPARRSRNAVIICGHWSALGLQQRPDLYALDTGCVWGGKLTAMRLEDRAIFQEPCSPEDLPRKI